MFKPRKVASNPLPADFLTWQVRVRAYTMEERNGAPHVGVAPLLTVRRAGFHLGVTSHSIICGLLPRPELLAAKTAEFRQLFESTIAQGARITYDQGIAYLKDYYQDPTDFDTHSITTLLRADSPIVQALRTEDRCQLVFYVFNLTDRTEVGRLRCLQLDCRAEVLSSGPVYDNVWWHNTLFHGEAEESVVIHFHHQQTYDTCFGKLEAVA